MVFSFIACFKVFFSFFFSLFVLKTFLSYCFSLLSMEGFQEIVEHKTKVFVPLETKVSRELDVFYNPRMELNRDISIILLNCLDREELKIALPLAGTGIRGVRFLKELPELKINKVFFNDVSPKAVDLIKKNLELNDITEGFDVSNNDASKFLLNNICFDYIDIDPFGPPGPFLDSAIKKLSRGGILAVTATDTGALCGSFPKACNRKYWALPKKDSLMHERGLRILIRKVQLVASQYDVALFPIFCYDFEHYMRAFFICKKGKKLVDEVLSKHELDNNSGPLWIGKIFDESLVEEMNNFIKNDCLFSKNKELVSFIELINSEKSFSYGFFDIHEIVKKLKLSAVPKFDKIFEQIISKGFLASRTHFSQYGIKSDIGKDELVEIIKSL